MKTILKYRLNGVLYQKTFSARVSYGTVERFLIMEKHLGLSAHKSAIVEIQNLL